MADDDWDADLPLHKLSLDEEQKPQQQAVPSEVAFSAHVAAVHDTAIDPTLVDALGNPRERMNVLKFEDIIASFVQSRDDVLETPPLSSYHRLLVYRLAARFQLEHAKSETLCMEPDRHAICLYKTTSTCFPKTLLIHMAQSTPAGESSTAQPQPTKIKLMKRNSSDSNRPVRSEKESQSRSNISMTERERQYAEARARIFGTSSPSPSTEGKEDGDGASSESAPSITRDRSRSPTSTEGEDRPAEAPAAGPTSVSSAASAIGTKGPRRKVVNPGTWQGKKGVLRDKEAEKNDPDFRRHHHPPAYRNPSPTYVPYGAAMDPHMGRGDGSWMPPQQHAHVPYGAGMHYPVYGMDAYQQYYHQGYQQHAQVPRPPPPSAYDYNQEFPPLK